jgi:putative CocE/NonD family hydrolase
MPPCFRLLAVALCAALIITAHPAFADDLKILARVQLADGHPAEAEAILEKLQALLQNAEPRQADAVVPWRIFARAQRYQGEGLGKSAALGRAFAEIFGALSDAQMADVLPEFHNDLDWLRKIAARAAPGDEAIAAHEAVVAWTYLQPAVEPLIRADAERRFIIDDQLLIPTPDGAQIAAMLVRPRQAGAAKLTALLNFTIYANDRWSFADAVKMAAHGYAGMVAYVRGKGRSPGPVVPYEHDGADAATVIEWLAAQPWSDRRVGMFSGSYNASTQWAALKHHPAALKAIATNASNAPGIDTPMQGNVFRSFIYPWPFYTTDTKGLDDALYDDTARWQKLEHDWYVSGRPYRDLDKIDGKPNPIFDSWLDHPAYDSFWQKLLPYGREFADIDIPVFVQTGYYDGGMVGALYYLEQHLKYRPSADHRLLVGPYHHTAMQTGVLPVIEGYAIDRAARIDLQEVRLQWFDHVFHGAPLPDLLRGRVNFEVMGADTWRHADRLDQMAPSRRRLYLTAERQGDFLRFGRAAGTSEPVLSVDLADRSDSGTPMPKDRPDLRNALVFATAPLKHPAEVDGLFQGHFDIVVNKRDVDLAVDFYERRADGRYLPLASYLGRASYADDRSRRRLLEPGVPHRLDFQSQTLTARLLAPGSRIVAVIGIPKRPDRQIDYGSGKDVSDESIADAHGPTIIRWLKGSYLEIGTVRHVVTTASENATAPNSSMAP